MKVCLLEPYYGGSHRSWVDGLRSHSRHRVDLLSLPARHWKWRMHGAAVSFAEQLITSGKRYDLLLASSMMDVAVFRGLLHAAGISSRVATYFHENQLGYPVSPQERFPRDLRFEYINYTTALASDRLFFNSDFHRKSFLEALPGLLRTFPDHRNQETLERITEKSVTLHLGMDLQGLSPDTPPNQVPDKDEPLLLWNHRWEFDKRPEVFLDLLAGLRERGIGFKAALLGARGENAGPLLRKAREELGDRILVDQPAPDGKSYAKWLHRADILPVTSIQDFFGGSVVEAARCGCHPLLPRRLAYPEIFGNSARYFDRDEEALDRLSEFILSGEWKVPFPGAEDLERFDWKSCIGRYDEALASA